jgi:hypothetical protein
MLGTQAVVPVPCLHSRRARSNGAARDVCVLLCTAALGSAGVWGYFSVDLNKLDFLIVVLSLVDLSLAQESKFTGFRVLRVLRWA